MSGIAPEGAVYQAGTLSGNPLVMAAGAAMLRQIEGGKVYARIDELARHLEDGLTSAIRRAEAPAAVARVGSMVTLFFRDGAPRDYPRRASRIRRCSGASTARCWSAA